jgi:hypothetical protein
MPELTPEDQVIRGENIKRFFADRTVLSVVQERTERYFVEWLRAATLEERELIWHKARALEDLVDECQAVADAGDRATWDQTQLDKPQG